MTRLHDLKGLPKHILQQIKKQLDLQDDTKRNLSGVQEESKRNGKYNATKVEQEGIKFDSLKEQTRYNELFLLEKAGEIKELRVHPKFILQEAFRKDGIIHRQITYTPDFMYVENGRVIVEDVKAWDRKKKEYITTEVFRLKQKLFEKRYNYLSLKITGKEE